MNTWCTCINAAAISTPHWRCSSRCKAWSGISRLQQAKPEARLRRQDGIYRWFLFRSNPLRDETGVIVKWYGVNTDIDDRKKVEEALRSSERNCEQSRSGSKSAKAVEIITHS